MSKLCLASLVTLAEPCETLSTPELVKDNNILISPNPFSNELNIETVNNIKLINYFQYLW